ncbi:MAG: peptidylprolyl isomerase [Polaribacter sp.]|uniref:peptidylprolyl isomerase n=1 Tax=Polaribacter sp. TaxID=1920175 RepID=UPI003BAF94A8
MKQGSYILFFSIFIFSCTAEKYKSLNDGLYAEIQTNRGDILLELYANNVPMTVANFVSLAEGTSTRVTDSLKGKNYFDGLTFHRVVPNFIIQGGDPTASGRGNPGYLFGDEFTKDENGGLRYKHDDVGVLSMANSGPDANGSQFFITHKAIPHLNNKHSVFGKTIVNSLQLKKLKTIFKDALKLQKAIDSVRMITVNKIQQADTIKKVEIIRIGSEAKSFNAEEVFNDKIVKYNALSEDKKELEAKQEIARYAKYLKDKKVFLAKMDESNAIKTDSGLRFLLLKSNPKGKKMVGHKPVKSNFTLYTADGVRIQSTEESGQPFVFQLNDSQKPMITGFKEGVSKMREGEKARLFIPYYIGFGTAKYGPFPAKSDLVFEVEIIEISK